MNIIIHPDKLIYTDPYLVNGHRKALVSRKAFFGQPGVYLIREDGVLVYVGMSKSNVYQTLYRHFERWNDGRGVARTIYPSAEADGNRFQVSIITTTEEYAPILERELIRKWLPRDNKQKYKSIINEAELAEFFAEVMEDDIPF